MISGNVLLNYDAFISTFCFFLNLFMCHFISKESYLGSQLGSYITLDI